MSFINVTTPNGKNITVPQVIYNDKELLMIVLKEIAQNEVFVGLCNGNVILYSDGYYARLLASEKDLDTNKVETDFENFLKRPGDPGKIYIIPGYNYYNDDEIFFLYY